MDRRVSKCITIIPEQPGSTRARQARARRTCARQVAALRIVLLMLFLAAAQSAAPAEIELQCSLTVDGRPAGEIPVLIDESENRLSAIGEAVLERAAPLARLPKHVNRQEWWTPDELQVLGLEAVFDVNALALELHIAEAVRVPERHRQGTRQTAQDATVHSELISGGINITANASAGREALYEDETDEVEAGVSFALDPFVNIDGWVLEGSLRADSRIPNAFPLVAARVVRDDMQRELRFEAGSLRYPVSGALTRVQMQGLAVYRLFANDGERSHIPDSVEFDVEKPTTVTLTLNGENIMTRYLYAGPHIVEDLPLTQGRNELVIADNGEQRVIPLPFDESLLARSHTDFSLSVGVLSDDFAAELDAEKHKPAASGFARLGITPAWTAGVYAHGDPDTVMGGIETVHATGAGVIRANASASKSGGAPGAKASLNWMTSAEDSAFAAALVSVSATTRKFATAGVLARDNRNWLETWGSAAFRIGKSASLTNSVRLRFAAGSIIPSFGASATGKVTVAPSVHVTATVRADVASTGQTAFGGMIAVGWVPTSAAGIRASASQDFSSLATDAAVSGNGGKNLSDFKWNTSIRRVQEAEAPWLVRENLKYGGSRGTMQLSIAGEAGDDPGIAAWAVDASAETAILFAGTSLAIGKPARDSFVLFRTHPALGSAVAGIKAGDRWNERTGVLGTGVLSGIGSNRVQKISFAVDYLPEGADSGNLAHVVFPGYRSGYSIVLGTDAEMYATGQLVDQNGLPVLWSAGIARSADTPAGIRFFSDENGNFEIAGLKAGEWVLELPKKGLSAVIVLPDDAKGWFEAGTVKMEAL